MIEEPAQSSLLAPSPRVRVIDTETAGHKLAEDAVIEIGSVDLDLVTGDTHEPMETLVDPAGVEIVDAARKVHKISDEMLEGAPAFAEAILRFEGAETYAAHRMSFDKPRLGLKGRWLCTWKLALRAFPEQRAHGLQTLVKRLELTPDTPDTLYAHRALYDAICTAALLRAIANVLMPRCDGIADFLKRAEAVSAEPGLLRRLRFGQHKGKPIAEVPADYLEWMLREPDMNADAKFTADHELKRRLRGVRARP
ncbi:MAG: exonuclease domain-containing protein [Pseudomonadota bacterium]